VIHLGVDPIYPDYPIHSFPRDITIPADPRLALPLLAEALAEATRDKQPAVDARRQRAHDAHDATLEEAAAVLESVRHESPIHPLWLSHCLGQVLEEDSIVVNEYPLTVGQLGLSQPGSYFGLSPAGGLGWGFGAALGAKLAAPDKLVAVGLGDGAYMFSNPTPCHWVSAKEGLPILTVVRNNQRWGAVQAAAARMYPEGRWVQQEHRPLIDLTPSPAFELVAQASGAHAERVEDPQALPDALERAVRAVQGEGRQALLNVIAG
jgi:acetolactate synthase-1/2/3 large subunit